MEGKIIKGNIYKNRSIQKSREKGGQDGWVLGWFAKKPFKTKNVEIKLGDHKKGKKKKHTGVNNKAKTLVVLINGKFLTNFYNRKGIFIKKIILNNPGDFNFYNPGVAHDWIALKDSRTLTIRWPSIPKDQRKIIKI